MQGVGEELIGGCGGVGEELIGGCGGELLFVAQCSISGVLSVSLFYHCPVHFTTLTCPSVVVFVFPLCRSV